jgi:hypothetical protein
MIESEAKKRWCPFVRVTFDPHTATLVNNRMGVNHDRCIGHECMAWRSNHDETYGTSQVWCGLAGKAGVE